MLLQLLRSCGTLTNKRKLLVFNVGFLCVPNVCSFSLHFYKKEFMLSVNVTIK